MKHDSLPEKLYAVIDGGYVHSSDDLGEVVDEYGGGVEVGVYVLQETKKYKLAVEEVK